MACQPRKLLFCSFARIMLTFMGLGRLTMDEGLIGVLAAGICAFGVGIDRDQDGCGRLAPREPGRPCATSCDFCQLQAEFLAMIAAEYLGIINVNEQPA